MASGMRINQVFLMSKSTSIFAHQAPARHLHGTFILLSDKMGKPDPR